MALWFYIEHSYPWEIPLKYLRAKGHCLQLTFKWFQKTTETERGGGKRRREREAGREKAKKENKYGKMVTTGTIRWKLTLFKIRHWRDKKQFSAPSQACSADSAVAHREAQQTEHVMPGLYNTVRAHRQQFRLCGAWHWKISVWKGVKKPGRAIKYWTKASRALGIYGCWIVLRIKNNCIY